MEKRSLSTLITYEFPLNERIRTFLRVERLFDTIDFFMKANSEYESRIIVDTILELVALLNRADLKAECLQELDRYTRSLERLMDNPEVAHDTLAKLLGEIIQTSTTLYSNQNKLGASILENELLKTVAQKGGASGNTCGFDLPYYHYWLQKDQKLRRQDLVSWIDSLDSFRKSIQLSLHLIRNSAITTREHAEKGCFLKVLDSNQPFQLIQVQLPPELPYFVEFSGGKQRFSIRFMDANIHERPLQTQEDLEFSLSCCAF